MIRLLNGSVVKLVDSEEKAKSFESKGFRRENQAKSEDEDLEQLKAFAAENNVDIKNKTSFKAILKEVEKAGLTYNGGE